MLKVYVVIASVVDGEYGEFKHFIIAAENSGQACKIVNEYKDREYSAYSVQLLDRTDNDYDVDCTVKTT